MTQSSMPSETSSTRRADNSNLIPEIYKRLIEYLRVVLPRMNSPSDAGDDGDYDPLRGLQRVFTTQLLLCLWIGISSFLLFCALRYKWPHIYAIRTLRRKNSIMKIIPLNYFGWIKLILTLNDNEVLEYSGLDAYVFLMFFKMGVVIFFQLGLVAVFFISPIRYYYTGHYDKDEIPWIRLLTFDEHDVSISKKKGDGPDLSDPFPKYLWVYPIFVYVFSTLVYVNVYDYTNRILKTRQKYLASQNSITDRTIRIDGIPRRLLQKSTDILKDFIEDLGIGKVSDIKVIYDCSPLDQLVKTRRRLLFAIERYLVNIYKLNIDIYDNEYPRVTMKQLSKLIDEPTADTYLMKQLNELSLLDEKISTIQSNYKQNFNKDLILHNDPYFKIIPSAFVTMDSVASAQMAAQTVLDPRVYKLMVNLAPAPKDIIWSNLKISYYHKLMKQYFITFIIILSYFPILFLVSSLATLLDLTSISKFWPALGELIKKSDWLTTVVTGILPPMLYSLLNLTLPYFYRYLSRHQGYASNSDIELSALLKNFFYVFFNLFLVFIITGTIWDYLSFIRDTTKIAYQLASSLKKKSLFYVDLILLQGLAMFPVRLLQIGDVVLLNLVGKVFFIKDLFLKTPRDYRFYYFTPPVFDFGIQLPQHLLIFIIILIYSLVSTKIVTSGLVYFSLGYLVYKYQLIYNYVHPPHSTGKVWPMIFRRLMLGTILFQLFMVGTLALEGAVLLSVLCFPLIIITLVIIYNYEKYYLPLNNFIALRAIQSPLEFDKEFEETENGSETDLEFQTSAGQSTPNNINDINQNYYHSNNNSNQDDILVIEQSSTLQSDCNDTSMLVNGDFTVDYGTTHLTNPHKISTNNLRKRRISTIDEEREQFTNYTYPNLIYELDGPMIGFDGDNITLLKPVDDIENQSSTTQLSLINKNPVVPEWE